MADAEIAIVAEILEALVSLGGENAMAMPAPGAGLMPFDVAMTRLLKPLGGGALRERRHDVAPLEQDKSI